MVAACTVCPEEESLVGDRDVPVGRMLPVAFNPVTGQCLLHHGVPVSFSRETYGDRGLPGDAEQSAFPVKPDAFSQEEMAETPIQ
mgnify:CR=1 FL=1